MATERGWVGVLKLYGPVSLIVLFSFVLAFQFIKPAPPDSVRIATGSTEGSYYAFAQQFAEVLAREGIQLEVVATGGSVDNAQLLSDGQVDLAFIQGGVASKAQSQNFEALGSMYFEPLWLFHQADLNLDRLPALRGLKVGIGDAGSGTAALVEQLLSANGVDARNATLQAISSSSAASALKRGELDAAFYVISPTNLLVQELLENDQIKLASFSRAAAYVQRFPYLSVVQLAEGAVDLASNNPNRTIDLLASSAQLVAKPDLHPAIVDLLLVAAEQLHGQGGWFETAGQFPSDQFLDFPLNKEAARFYKHGPPLLQRFLPFWAASLIDRLKIMLLPLIVLLMPLFKIMPPLYQWRMRSRIYRWYRELENVNLSWSDSQAPDRREQAINELERIDNEVLHIEVPLSYSEHLYHLRQHIQLVRQKIQSEVGDNH
ncbi:MAG: TAXI family TRAP transporter solute-binding subunit [Candidatus Competibacteraceae bacterium]|jgi:TRAP transporter TAXI family solute receptor|nr:TAXI family TRAP transporter solute-binding subunit [Candidatus Competibacteraceae bacterium]